MDIATEEATGGGEMILRSGSRINSTASASRRPSSRRQSTDDAEIPMDMSDTSTTEEEKQLTLNYLPTELILEVMSYLDYGDLLVARQVCKRWNMSISGWIGFTDKVVLRLLPDSEVLEKSDVSWKNIEMAGLPVQNFPVLWRIPACVDESLSSLVLKDGQLSMNFFAVIGNRFPNVTKLAIIKCGLESWPGMFGEQCEGFKNLTRRLKTLELEVRDLRDLNILLEEFLSNESALDTLDVALQPKAWEFETVPNYPRVSSAGEEPHKFISGIKDLISANRTSLRVLNIRMDYRMGPDVGSCFKILEQEKVHINLREFRLQWNVHIHDRFQFTSLQAAEIHIKNFLKTQTYLQSLYIPRLEKNISAEHGHSDIVNVIPRGLRELGTGQLSIVDRLLFQKLPDLKILKIDFPPSLLPTSPVAFHLSGALSDTIYPEMECVSITGNPLSNLVTPIIYGFPNLRKLEIKCSTGKSSMLMINDHNLQLIIQNLLMLNVLNLDSGHQVTDYGICGITQRDSKTLLQSGRSWYMEEDLPYVGVQKTGYSLCSLKYLREFSLVGSFCHITDVGIRYGFDFEDLRKFRMVADDQISEYGLLQFARMNPKLELCEIMTSSRSEGLTEAKVIFEKLLPRLNKRHLQLVF